MLRMNESSVVAIDELDLTFAPQRWPFADARRAEIDAHFAALLRKSTGLWNGRVLLLSECKVEHRTLRGRCFETDYASFIAWRDWGWPDETVTNCFAMGALQAADGAFLVGVMGPHTANAGRIYFPAGTPEPEDIRGSVLDLESNVVREVAEETGLTADDFTAEAGWCAVSENPRLCLMKRLRSGLPAVELRARILDHLAVDPEPEFADIRIIRGQNDLDAMMPHFVVAFLRHVWG
jgi:hypothetical protein